MNRGIIFQIKPFVVCLSVMESIHALYVSVLLCALLLGSLPPTGMSGAHIRHSTLRYTVMLTWRTRCEIMFTLLSVSCLLWQEQRKVMQPAGGRRGRNEASPTGACGRQTFLGGWRSFELRQLMKGWRTWLVPSGLTSPSAAIWAMIVPSLTLNLNHLRYCVSYEILHPVRRDMFSPTLMSFIPRSNYKWHLKETWIISVCLFPQCVCFLDSKLTFWISNSENLYLCVTNLISP